MPTNKEEFEAGKLPSKVEDEITSFLKERKEAFTSQEIMEGIHYHTDFSTPEVAKMSTFAIANFAALLHDLVRRKRVKMKVVRGRMYFVVGTDDIAKCPKCRVEATAKKTWKMAGRPDKKGERLQLHIGLYNCPKHGYFRKVLAKRKI